MVKWIKSIVLKCVRFFTKSPRYIVITKDKIDLLMKKEWISVKNEPIPQDRCCLVRGHLTHGIVNINKSYEWINKSNNWFPLYILEDDPTEWMDISDSISKG